MAFRYLWGQLHATEEDQVPASEIPAAAAPVAAREPVLESLLVGDWNVYVAQTHWAQTQPFPIKPRLRSAQNLETMGRLIAWCRARFLEPRLWLYFLFKRRGWRFCPKFKDADLMSEKMVPSFKGLRGGVGFFKKRMAAAQGEAGAVAYDPNRDLAAAVEHLKRRYLHGVPGFQADPQRCLDEQLINTNGFHPGSDVCCACPLATECALRLEASVPFPILALRAGRFTAAEAAALADRC